MVFSREADRLDGADNFALILGGAPIGVLRPRGGSARRRAVFQTKFGCVRCRAFPSGVVCVANLLGGESRDEVGDSVVKEHGRHVIRTRHIVFRSTAELIGGCDTSHPERCA